MLSPRKPHLRLWVQALRSGEFQQAIGVLRDEDGRMCCLGVAQVVAMRHGFEDPDYWGSNGMHPVIANVFYGFSTDPSLQLSTTLDVQDFASSCNDRRQMTFDQIANAIERTYKLNEPDIDEES